MTREEIIDFCDMKAQLEPENEDIFKAIIKTLEQEPCEDVISRKSIKQKLQEHHDFFVNAYGGFCNLSQNDKSRVDEITNCIAMVVNEPSVTPQELRKGHWIDDMRLGYHVSICSNCDWRGHGGTCLIYKPKYCPNCGCHMVEAQESEDKE